MAVVALAAVFLVAGGLGYACSTGGVGGYGKGPPPAIDLSWTSPVATVRSESFVGCTSSFTPAVLTFHVSNLAPGASCALSATIKNLGTLPVSLRDAISMAHSSSCSYFAYSDNVAGLSKEPVVDPEHLFDYRGVFSLGAKAGNSCEGAVASVTVTISGASPCLISHSGETGNPVVAKD